MGDKSRLHAIKKQGGMMARVLNPLNSQDAKGSIGGITYTKSPAGNVAKKKSDPVRRSEPYKQSNRSRVGFLARAYGGLTQAQRNSWKDWAIDHPQPDGFGGTFIMSGINAFVKLNFNAMRMGGTSAWEVLPPAAASPASIATFSAVTGATNAGDIDLTWTHNGTAEATDFNEIQIAGPFLSPGRKEVYSRFKYENAEPGTTLLRTVPNLDEDMYYWFRCRYIDEAGQVSAWLYSQATPKVTV